MIDYNSRYSDKYDFTGTPMELYIRAKSRKHNDTFIISTKDLSQTIGDLEKTIATELNKRIKDLNKILK